MEADQEFTMNVEKNRAVTFADWPFDNEDCACVSTKMAEAGFFHIPTDREPDLVKCFCCLKELDGWEQDDDPWLEHKRHSPKCWFVKLSKPEAELKIEDFVKLECERQKARVEKICQDKIQEFKERAATVRKQLEEM